MQLRKLYIDGFKNIKKQEIVFPENLSYLTLIGLNGSGKSNYMEALSLILNSYYRGKKDDIFFEYELVYVLSNNKICCLSNDNDTVDGNRVKLSNIPLPRNVIACYSGESQRLWNIAYKDFYEEFFNKAVNNEYEEPRMLYVNKDVWTISLIALMCSTLGDITNFLETHFNIKELAEVTLNIQFNEENLGAYKSTELTGFLRRIKEDGKFMSSVATMDIGNRLIPGSIEYCRHIFFYLYLACLPKRNDVNKIDAVIEDIDIVIGDMSYKNISEGEKKLLLIECITKILGGEDSLLILDEPDSHVHIANKHLICQLCEDFRGQTVMSTHSPYVINEVDFDSLRFVELGTVKRIDSIRNITTSITDGSFDVIDGTMLIANKKLVVTEGPYDVKYIKHAAKQLAQDNPRYNLILTKLSFVFQSGANSTEDYFKTVVAPIISQLDKVLFVFDVDADSNQNGQKGYKKIIEFKQEYGEKVDAMFYAINYPIDVERASPCYVEDFFPLSTKLADVINRFHTPPHFSDIKEANNISSSMKKDIQKNFKDFNKEDLIKFKALLDEILRNFGLYNS